jgi:hypothetical protein
MGSRKTSIIDLAVPRTDLLVPVVMMMSTIESWFEPV